MAIVALVVASLALVLSLAARHYVRLATSRYQQATRIYHQVSAAQRARRR
ncbi:MAG: hypothetical protein HOY76_08365 [Streptomyces sp.]|nr:hypothetical protein [Streptomyces sp.]